METIRALAVEADVGIGGAVTRGDIEITLGPEVDGAAVVAIAIPSEKDDLGIGIDDVGGRVETKARNPSGLAVVPTDEEVTVFGEARMEGEIVGRALLAQDELEVSTSGLSSKRMIRVGPYALS